MRKRFIISTSNLVGQDQQRKFAESLNASGLNWWHWLPNTWLVVDDHGNYNAGSFGKILRQHFPSAFFLVLEYRPSNDWAGYGPTGSGKSETDMFAWIKQYWLTPDEVSQFLY